MLSDKSLTMTGSLSWWPLHLAGNMEFKGDDYPINPMSDEEDKAVRAVDALLIW